MTLVTYLPRALPAWFTEKRLTGAKTQKFLKLLPYTAMSALIFPGIFSIDVSHPFFGVIAGATAVLLALKRCPFLVCVLGAIGINILLYWLV